jgi:DNA-binding transcriptional LysR family regulator
MNFHRVDLNLLAVFHAIFETRSVTLAAERFGITQPAMSNALARLRDLCGDALFVPTTNGMQPTPYALEIADTIGAALRDVQAALGHRKSFDPATNPKTFRFHLTDMGQMYFLPPLLEHLAKTAPSAKIEAETLVLDALRDAMEDGRIDFALGKLPKLAGRGIRSKVLFAEHYDVLMRAGHPAAGARLSSQAFLAASHAVVSTASGGHRIIEETLLKVGASIVLRVPNFTVIPTILQRADMLVVVPHRLAVELAAPYRLVAIPLPIEIPPFNVSAFWHERFDADPAIAWMRRELFQLFGETNNAGPKLTAVHG